MELMMIALYPATVERHMAHLYESLSEKDRRRYAAVEAEKLGHGGLQDIEQLPADPAGRRVRKKGRPKAS
jgi:hypothetical protein